MSHLTTPHAAEVPASAPEPPTAAAPADGREPTITESVATALSGVVLGGTAIWFLAPICFAC